METAKHPSEAQPGNQSESKPNTPPDPQSDPQSNPPSDDQVLSHTDLHTRLQDDLLAAFLAAQGPGAAPIDPAAIALKFDISLQIVLDFFADPATQARLAAAASLFDLVHHRRLQAAQAKAVAVLESIIDDAETDPVERRRAASALLRTATRKAPRPQATRRDSDPPVRFLGRPEDPSSSSTPMDVLHTVLHRLSHNDNPTPDAGLTTLYNHLHYSRRPTDPQRFLDDPGSAYLDLLHASAAVLFAPPSDLNLPARSCKANEVHIPLTLHFKDERSKRLKVELVKHFNSLDIPHWTIRSITPAGPPTGP